GRRPGVEYSLEHAGDHLLVVHNDGHEGFALATAPLADPGRWTTILSAGEGERFESVDAFARAAVLELRSGGLASVRVIPRRDPAAGSGADGAAGAAGTAGADRASAPASSPAAVAGTAGSVWDAAAAWDISHGGELDSVWVVENPGWEQ